MIKFQKYFFNTKIMEEVKKIKNYEVVVPPLSVQETIVYRVMVLKNKIKDNLKMAIVKKQKAETNFEQTIFE